MRRRSRGDTIGEVIGWLDAQDDDAPVQVLADAGDPAAQVQLEWVLGLDSRNRGTTYMSASNLLAAYRYPEVLASARSGFTPDLDALYHRLLAPSAPARAGDRRARLMRARAGVETSRAQCAPLKRLLRVLLDETANCAPLQDLPAHLSQLPHTAFKSQRSGSRSPRHATATARQWTRSWPPQPASSSWDP